MKVSDGLIRGMKRFEGCYLKSYRDDGGVWTIGYGHTRGVKAGQEITIQQAESLLRGDLLTFERAVGALYPKAAQREFDALVSLAYNAGIGAVSGGLYTLIRRGSPKETVQRWWQSHYITCKGVRLNGLVKRRKWESLYYYGEC